MKTITPHILDSTILHTMFIPQEGIDGHEWRLEYLWFTNMEKGGRQIHSYTTCDSDGDHCTFDGRMVSTYGKEAAESWKQYVAWCAEAGQDPLRQFPVQRTIKRTRNYTIFWRSWIGASEYGLAVYEALGQGKRITPDKFPKHLAEYLCLKKQGAVWFMEGIHKPEDMIEAGCVGRGYSKISVEFQEPRKAKTVSNEIKKYAASVALGL